MSNETCHDHDHDHSPSHGHHHHNVEVGPKLMIAFFITVIVFGVELSGGYWTHSLALLSDAWHQLTDAAALGLAWVAFQQAKKNSSLEKTFGYHRFEVIVAFINGLSLVLITGYIFYEAIFRIITPEAVKSKEMFIIATVGVVANGLIAIVLNASAKSNINVKSAFLHVLGDTLASLGVIIGGILMLKYRWYVIDPLISIVISLMILKGAWRVTKEAFHILMEGAPENVNLLEIVNAIKNLEGVTDVHDLHAWSISGNLNSLSMHVQINLANTEEVLTKINRLLKDEFNITHSTVQVERECCQIGRLICNLQETQKQVAVCGHAH